MMDDIRIHSSLPAGHRSAHDTVPRHFGPPGAVDYRTLPSSRTARSDDPMLVFSGMLERQPKPLANVNILKGTAYSFKNRQIISRWIRDVCAAFKLRTTTFNLGVQLCDIFMMHNLQGIAVGKCQCVALACIWLAAKFEELDPHVPPAQQLSDVCDRAYPPQEIIDMEERVLTTLRWRLPHTVASNFVYFYFYVLTHNAGFESAPMFERQPQQQQQQQGSAMNKTRYVLLKPGTQSAAVTSAPPPSAGPPKPETTDEWVDVTQIVVGAQQINLADERVLIDKLCVAMGLPAGAAGQHTTLLQLLGKSLVLAYKIRPGSVVSSDSRQAAAAKASNPECGIEVVHDGSHLVRLFLRVDQQDGTFSECRGVSLLRGPNSELLRHTDALTREALLHVEFLPCTAHEMGLAILTSALIATSADTAEISLLMGMMLRRLKIDAAPGTKWVAATSLLCEKAAAAGVIGGGLGAAEAATAAAAPEQQAAAAMAVIKQRMQAVLDSCCALSSSSSSRQQQQPASQSKQPQQQQQPPPQPALAKEDIAGL